MPILWLPRVASSTLAHRHSKTPLPEGGFLSTIPQRGFQATLKDRIVTGWLAV